MLSFGKELTGHDTLQDKEREKIKQEMNTALDEKDKKLMMVKDVLEAETPVARPRTFKTPGTRANTRTYTTPGKTSHLILCSESHVTLTG